TVVNSPRPLSNTRQFAAAAITATGRDHFEALFQRFGGGPLRRYTDAAWWKACIMSSRILRARTDHQALQAQKRACTKAQLRVHRDVWAAAACNPTTACSTRYRTISHMRTRAHAFAGVPAHAACPSAPRHFESQSLAAYLWHFGHSSWRFGIVSLSQCAHVQALSRSHPQPCGPGSGCPGHVGRSGWTVVVGGKRQDIHVVTWALEVTAVWRIN
ncbi:hypothetical protein B0H10DRAFT_1959373, partial [Mycena sp. CBHHK59/15]